MGAILFKIVVCVVFIAEFGDKSLDVSTTSATRSDSDIPSQFVRSSCPHRVASRGFRELGGERGGDRDQRGRIFQLGCHSTSERFLVFNFERDDWGIRRAQFCIQPVIRQRQVLCGRKLEHSQGD